MQKKYQVFVSSTFRDLVDERQDAIRSILDLGHIPAGMELFPAADTEQLTYIKKVIDECDYYVLIMGGRYGSLDDEGVSFTEREYDYAVESGKVVLAFPHGNLGSISVDKSDIGARMRENLQAFRAKVMTGRLVREWTSREQLEAVVTKALVRAMAEMPATGWVRGDTAASENLLRQVNELRDVSDQLKMENRALKRAQSPSLPGLAGLDEKVTLRFYKTSMVNRVQRRTNTEFTFIWKEIFVAVGGNVTVPKSVSLISSLLDKHRRERDRVDTIYHLFDADVVVVKIQLVALGLINAYVGKTVKDGTSHEFMTVTENGKKLLAESLAIRSRDLVKLIVEGLDAADPRA